MRGPTALIFFYLIIYFLNIYYKYEYQSNVRKENAFMADKYYKVIYLSSLKRLYKLIRSKGKLVKTDDPFETGYTYALRRSELISEDFEFLQDVSMRMWALGSLNFNRSIQMDGIDTNKYMHPFMAIESIEHFCRDICLTHLDKRNEHEISFTALRDLLVPPPYWPEIITAGQISKEKVENVRKKIFNS